MTIPGVWKVYPVKELSVAAARVVLGSGTSLLINKLCHDHPGPLISLCVRLKQSNPATHAQPRARRACKLTHTSGRIAFDLPRHDPYSSSILDIAAFLFRDSLPVSQLRDGSAFDSMSFNERMIDYEGSRRR